MSTRFARLTWLFTLMLTMAALGCQAAQPSPPSQPKQSQPAKKPDSVVRLKLIVFHARWCGPCQKAKPIVTQIEATGVEVVRIDIDANASLVEKYHVTNVPTLILYRDGREIVRTHDVQEILATLPAQRNGQ